MKLSIILPVYNAQVTIERCVDSINNQESAWSSIEIVVCNDGSTDNSEKVLDDLAVKHSNILLFHLAHQGVYKTRNFALSQVTGDYLWFIDSDDFISNNSLNLIYQALSETKLDILHFGYFEHLPDGTIKKVLPNMNEIVETGFEFLDKSDGRLYLCFNVFNINFLKSNKIIFLGKSISHEDFLFNLTAFSKAKRVNYLNEAIYTYCYNPKSITKTVTTDHLLKVGKSFENIHLESKLLRDGYAINSNEYNILNYMLMHSISVFYLMLFLGKYPITYVRHILKFHRKEKLLPLTLTHNTIKSNIFQRFINMKYPFIVFCKMNKIFNMYP